MAVSGPSCWGLGVKLTSKTIHDKELYGGCRMEKNKEMCARAGSEVMETETNRHLS